LREPERKHGYNIAVTAVSVFVAIGVGGVELLGLIAGHVENAIGHVPLVSRMLDSFAVTGSFAGFVVAAVLLLLWGIAAVVSRLRPRLPRSGDCPAA
jgi:high-affinity nickel-transport protein